MTHVDEWLDTPTMDDSDKAELMRNKDFRLGYVEKRLEQALDALNECRQALAGVLGNGMDLRQCEQAKLMAELVLSLNRVRKPQTQDGR